MEENNTVPATMSQSPQLSYARLIWTLITLMLFPLVGLILMWSLMNEWPKKVKMTVTLVFVGLIVILGIIPFLLALFLFSTKPSSYTKPLEVYATPTPKTTSTPTSMTVPTWKTYTNTQYNYTVSYPPTLDITSSNADGKITNVKTYEMVPRSDGDLPINTTNTVCFDADQPYFGPCPYYISVMKLNGGERDIKIYNSVSQTTLDKIFSLQVGQETDKQTTQNIGGGTWNYSTNYKRLPDETANGITFFVIENSKGFGGVADKRLFIKHDNNVYMLGTYQPLQEFKNFYSSFKFN